MAGFTDGVGSSVTEENPALDGVQYPDSVDCLLSSLGETQSKESELAMELQLERLRLQEALCARDAVVKYLENACQSIRQKSGFIERLEQDKDDLEKQIKLLNGRQTPLSTNTSAAKAADDKRKLMVEVSRLASLLRSYQNEITSLRSKHGGTPQDDAENVWEPDNVHAWEAPINRLVNLIRDTVPSVALRDASNDSPKLLSPNPSISETAAVPLTLRLDPASFKLDDFATEDGDVAREKANALKAPDVPKVAMTLQSCNAALADLPLPSETSPDVLRPIIIPAPFTLHDFLGTTPVSLRTQLSAYRIFQQSTTSWCPEREEHGYLLMPVFKCCTSPRVNTAHRWVTVDVSSKLNKATECFYNKDGKWYYAGIYKSFWLGELSNQEWDTLSAETTQALIKETLAGRKNTSPQNIYETGQLYAAGALRVACIGLQCIGFNNVLYLTLMEYAAKCAQTGKWRGSSTSSAHSPSTTWTTPVLPVSPNAGTGVTGTTASGTKAAGENEFSYNNEPQA